MKKLCRSKFIPTTDGHLVPTVSVEEESSSISAASSHADSSSPLPNTAFKESLREYMAQQPIPCPYKSWNEYRKYLKWLHPRLTNVTNWPGFSKVFLVSALEADGTDDIKRYLHEMAQPGSGRGVLTTATTIADEVVAIYGPPWSLSCSDRAGYCGGVVFEGDGLAKRRVSNPCSFS